jgi:phospholipid/cholesterol/gamma-HCH transport system ATP-binding protein
MATDSLVSIGDDPGSAADPYGVHSALERVLGDGGQVVGRLSYANTSVSFRVVEGRDAHVTLFLDRSPCAVVVGSEPAEIEITLTPGQASSFAAGRLSMTAAVVSGQVAVRGPSRRYLEVDPILRGLLDQAHAGGPDLASTVRPRSAATSAIDPDLLAIETRDVHKRFGRHRVLEGVDLRIPEGAISVVLGPSGTGKSVLLQHLIGVMRPDAGEVLIRGRALSRMSRAEILALRREIGVMFQDGALFSAMNVYENVAFPLRQHTDLDEAEVRAVVDDHLRSVGLAGAGARMPNQLSGGMRKRAGLARALVLNPGIVLCDEPDSGLDPVRTALLGDLLVDQHAQYGGTMVVVTHNVALAKRIADHMSVLWHGQVLESGLADDVLRSDTEFVQQFLAGEAEGPLGMDA